MASCRYSDKLIVLGIVLKKVPRFMGDFLFRPNRFDIN